MKKQKRRAVSWLMVLTLALSLLPAGALATGEEPVAAEFSSWDAASATLHFRGAAGQEYAIAEQNGVLDWSAAIEPTEEGRVTFSHLKCGTTYEVYTRIKDGDGRAAVTEAITSLESTAILTDDAGCLVGTTVTAAPDPEGSYLYQWFWDETADNGEGGTTHSYTSIECATHASYTLTEADVGKSLAVQVMTRGYQELELVNDIGPVLSGSAQTVEAPPPEKPFISSQFSEGFVVEGVPGQEYALTEKGGEPSWDEAVTPDEFGSVEFTGLTPATAYTVHTRVAGTETFAAGAPVSADVVLSLVGAGLITEKYQPGCTLEVTTDPEDTAGLTYQWCYGVVTPLTGIYDGWRRYDYFPIDGETDSTYVVKKTDVGKYLSVRMMKDGNQVYELSEIGPIEESCETLLEKMTTEEKISQMIMPTFRYYTDEQGKLRSLEEITPEVTAILQKRGFAGVIFFAQNAGETAKAVRLVDAMQTANAAGESRTQLLTAIDQEGGIVTRLGQGTQTPGNMALGAAGNLSATKEIATIIGQELGTIGFNLDFAPVVDVNNDPANPVIGVRSFSDDPQAVAKQGVAFMEGLQDTGTISTLKHFPGHGDTATDSHTGLPCVDKSYDELKQTELVPFQACIDAGAEAVMTAHIQYPQVETETYISKLTGKKVCLPATLSKTILTDILRGKMGFEGVIVTDALNMDAIAKHFDRMDVARLAIEAGVDILLMPVDTSTVEGIDALDQYITDVAKLVDEGTISMEKVDAAVLRVLHLKEEKGLLGTYDGSDLDEREEEAVSFVGSSANHEIEWGITKKAITLVKNENNVLPLIKEGQKVTVLTAYNNEVLAMEYAAGRLRDEGKLAKDSEVTVRSIYKMTFEDVKPLLEGQDHVIVVSEISREAALDPSNEKYGTYSALVDQIIETVHANGGAVTVLSCQLPYDVARYQAADALLIAWSAKGMSEDPRNPANGAVKQYGPNMPAALYLALSPDESPAGKLPVNIPALDDDYQYSDTVLYARGFGLTYTQQGQNHSHSHSGGGGGAVTNPVSVPASTASAVTHGSVKSSAASAKAGDRVTLTPQPDEGYVTAGVTVTDAKGNVIPVTQNADGTYSFTMPATAVSITPSFEKSAGTDDPGSDVSERFTDVSKTAWYQDAVQWAVDNGVMNGVSDTRFAPNDTATRAMVVTMLWRLAGEPAVASAAPFTDVKDGAWYAGAVAWAAATGAVNGTSADTFSPNEPVTREQLAAILYRCAQAGGMDVSVGEDTNILSYDDAFDVSEWAIPAMQWACGAGILNGSTERTLAPRDSATRAQIATMFMRFDGVK